MFMKRSGDQCTQTQYKEELQASRLHLKKKKLLGVLNKQALICHLHFHNKRC